MKKADTAESVLELARKRTAEVFDRYDMVSVSFSGGKDSTVVLNLALDEFRARKADGRIGPDAKLDVVFWDEECIHPPTVDYVRRTAQLPDVSMRWFCLPIKHRNACSKEHPYWYCWAPEEKDKWVRPLPPEAITELRGFQRKPHFQCMPEIFPREDALTVGLLIGIRADESLRRYRSVTSRTEDNWFSQAPLTNHVWQCKIIYDWNTLDVWTAQAEFGWDYNRSYDQMAQAGLAPSSQRVAHPFGQQPLQTLWMWRLCWPELWEKLCVRLPGANTAMRYARSPLYGSSGGAGKGDGETWEDAIRRELMKWAPEVRSQLAVRLRREIGKHNRLHPGVPIPDKIAHLDLRLGITSGITYKFLFAVTVKGDFKNRMNPVIPGREEIDAERDKAWGADWRERYPSIAARTIWHGKTSRWYTPTEARALSAR